jgi:serine/threonine-protein kinase HipA
MSTATRQQTVRVALGQVARPAGTLTYNKDGTRENSTFAYDHAWLISSDRF